MKKVDFRNISVYFSAASTKLSARRSEYKHITESLRSLGVKITYDWLSDKKRLKPEELFNKAIKGVKKADILIADITYPSVGVGEQITIALNMNIPVIAIFHKDKPQVSRFTMGMKSSNMILEKYNKMNLNSVLEKSIKEVLKNQYVKFNFISTKEINDYLEKMSNKLNSSKSQVLRDIIHEWIKKTEKINK